MQNDEVILLDTRRSEIFARVFTREYFIGLEGRFAEWAGSLLPFEKNILLVTEPGKEKETVVRLACRFSAILGYLKEASKRGKKRKNR